MVELAYCAGTRPQLPAGPDQPDDLQRDRLEPDDTMMCFPGRREPGPRLPTLTAPASAAPPPHPSFSRELISAWLPTGQAARRGRAGARRSPASPHWPSLPRPRSWPASPSARSANPPCTGS